MKKLFLMKFILAGVASFFLLTFFSGLIGRVSFGIILLRSFLFAFLGGGLAGLSYFLAVKFLDMGDFNPFAKEKGENFTQAEGVSSGGEKKNLDVVSESSPADYEIYGGSDEGDLIAGKSADFPMSGQAQGETGSVSETPRFEVAQRENRVAGDKSYNEEMDELDNLAEDFAAAENSSIDGILDAAISSGEDDLGWEGSSSSRSNQTTRFSDDVKLEEIGGPESSMEDYAKVVRTMLKKGE